MNAEHLQTLVREQRKLIKKLLAENLRLNEVTKTLYERIQGLELQQIVIEREVTDISLGPDLFAGNDQRWMR